MKILFLLRSSGVEKSTAFIEIVKALTERNVRIDLVIGSCENGSKLDGYYLSNPNISVKILNIIEKSQDHIQSNRIECIKNILKKLGLLEIVCDIPKIKQRYKFICNQKKAKSDSQYAFETFLSSPIRNYCINDEYDYIWTTDEYGLLWAEWINQTSDKKHKIIHHSLELYWEHYSLQKKKVWKYYREYLLFEEARKILLKANIILIQDEARWNVLVQYTGLDKKREKVIFPLSMKDYKSSKDLILHNKLSIDKEQRIIFYPTLLAPKRGCLKLVKAVKQLDKKYVTIIHGFSSSRGFVQKLKKSITDFNQVRISNTSFEYQELVDMHQDVWCVFLYYGESDNNDRFIANSSNKLVMSLQAGKPIITIGNQMLADLCKEYGCGIALKSWSEQEFASAIREIEKNYDLYCQNARKCFVERYDINLYANTLYSKLEENL